MIREEDFNKRYEQQKEKCRQSGDIRPIVGFIMELYDHENTWDYVKRIEKDMYDGGNIHHRINSIDDCMHAEWSKDLSGEYSILFYIIKAYRDTHPNEKVVDREYALGDYAGLFKEFFDKDHGTVLGSTYYNTWAKLLEGSHHGDKPRVKVVKQERHSFQKEGDGGIETVETYAQDCDTIKLTMARDSPGHRCKTI